LVQETAVHEGFEDVLLGVEAAVDEALPCPAEFGHILHSVVAR
jgi:hypothetical protein